MLSPRLKKTLGDIKKSRFRMFLAVCAVFIGITGIGAVLDSYSILIREMDKNYSRTVPSSAIITLENPDSRALGIIKSFNGIQYAEQRMVFTARFLTSGQAWKTIMLFIVPDFNTVKADRFFPVSGEWPPAEGSILIEKSALGLTGKKIDDAIVLKIPGGMEQSLRFSGIVHAPGLPPAWMEGFAFGFISPETAKIIGINPVMKEIRIVFTNESGTYSRSRENNRLRAGQLKDTLQKEGYKIGRMEIPQPGQHPHANQLSALLFLLQAFGILAFVLGVILLVNIISGMISREIKSIGIMKTIGASAGQIGLLYLGLVLAISILALSLGIPAGYFLARLYSEFASYTLNFQIFDSSVPAQIIILQIALGIIVPLAAAFIPVWNGSRVTIQKAIQSHGISSGNGTGLFNKLSIIPVSGRTAVILKNSLRKPARLLLTLLTLIIGGSLFIVSVNLRSLISYTVEKIFAARKYDAQVTLAKYYPEKLLKKNILREFPASGIEFVSREKAFTRQKDGSMSDLDFSLMFMDGNSSMVNPVMLEGDWGTIKTPGNILINQKLSLREKWMMGDTVTVFLNGKDYQFTVTGIINEETMPPSASVNRKTISQINGSEEQSKGFRIKFPENIEKTAAFQRLEDVLDRTGLETEEIWKLEESRKSIEDHLLIVSQFLLLMSIFIVIVGLAGLSSSMSINVLERVREIGVIRSIGATGAQVLFIYIMEGLVIGIFSALIASFAAMPLTAWIGSVFGRIFFQSPLEFKITLSGSIIWMALIAAMSIFASYYPAKKASGITVQKAIAYE